jgi:glycosyltransferase involved in cell wall biosynthesis
VTDQSQPKALPAILCLTDACDRPETELFIGLKRSGFGVDVMCNPQGRNYQRLVDENMVVQQMALKSRFDKDGIAAIRKQLNTKKYDIIHAYNPRALACGLQASKGTKIKVVAYRGIIGNVSFLNPESWITFLHPRVSKIVCVADAIKDFFSSLKFLWLRVPSSKLIRIYKGHDLGWYQAAPADLTQFGVPAGAFVVCSTGRNNPRKGYDVLIEAVSKLPTDVQVHLVLVGDAIDNAALQTQVSQSAYPQRIHFTGYRNDAPAIAAASNVFVLPSTEREGLPRAVIEAMAYGVPPIVTNVGGMPELVEKGVSGLVVPPKDAAALGAAIERLYRNPELIKQFGQAAQARIENHFHTSQTVRETSELYCSLADGY